MTRYAMTLKQKVQATALLSQLAAEQDADNQTKLNLTWKEAAEVIARRFSLAQVPSHSQMKSLSEAGEFKYKIDGRGSSPVTVLFKKYDEIDERLKVLTEQVAEANQVVKMMQKELLIAKKSTSASL